MPRWRNWSGSVQCEPKRFLTPSTEQELAAVIGAPDTELPIRFVGSGHSYTPLVETTGTVISLDRIEGIASTDAAAKEAVIRGGTKLHSLGEPLRAAGLALHNQGDVDYQALAGALATATHGTGQTLGCLSTAILGLRIVRADGSIFECDQQRDPDGWRAGKLHLGCFGAVTEVRLSLRSGYRLRDQTEILPLDEALTRLPALLAANRHVECWWFPRAEVIGVRTMAETSDRPNDRPAARWFRETVFDNWLFGLVAWLTRLPGLAGLRAPFSRLAARVAGEKPYVEWSFSVLATGRSVRANEMEYAVPAAEGVTAIRAVRDYVRKHDTPVLFPIEFRFVAGDDIPLSPFYRRDSAVLSIHQDARVDRNPYFRDVERILRELGGRPHWGKLHHLTAAELRPLYPEWDLFQTVRERLDPSGKFLTPHLRRVLGI